MFVDSITIKFYDCSGNALNCSNKNLDYLPLNTFEFVDSLQIESNNNDIIEFNETNQPFKYKLGSFYLENNNIIHICILNSINSYSDSTVHTRQYLTYLNDRFNPRSIKIYNVNYPHPLNNVVTAKTRINRYKTFFDFETIGTNVEII